MSKLVVGGCSGTSQHCRSSHGHHCSQPHLEQGAAKIPPEFSAGPAECIWKLRAGRGQPQHQERGSRAVSSSCVRGAASSQCLQGAGGECHWVQVCATSLVRQSKSLEQRKPPCEMGLALHSCTSIHADLGEFLKVLSQPPVMQDLAELVFLGGQGSHKTQANRAPWGCCSTSTAALSPWHHQRSLAG